MAVFSRGPLDVDNRQIGRSEPDEGQGHEKIQPHTLRNVFQIRAGESLSDIGYDRRNNDNGQRVQESDRQCQDDERDDWKAEPHHTFDETGKRESNGSYG